MSKPMGIHQTLEVVEDLKRTIQSTRNRAAGLEADLKDKTSRLNYRINQDIAALKKEMESRLEQAREERESKQKENDSKFEKRKARIDEAYTAASDHYLQAIEREEGRIINEAQREMLKLTRKQESAEKEIDREYRNDAEALEKETEPFVLLDQKVNRALRGYPSFRNRLEADAEAGELDVDESLSTSDLLEQFRNEVGSTRQLLNRYRAFPIAWLFGLCPVWMALLVVAILTAVSVPVVQRSGMTDYGWPQAGMVFGAAAAVVVILYLLGGAVSRSAARPLIHSLRRSRFLFNLISEVIESRYQEASGRIQSEVEEGRQHQNQLWQQAEESAGIERQRTMDFLDAKRTRANKRNESLHLNKVEAIDLERDRKVQEARDQFESRQSRLESGRNQQLEQCHAEQKQAWDDLSSEWREKTTKALEALRTLQAEAERQFADWGDPSWAQWNPPAAFLGAAPFGTLDLDILQIAGGLPSDERLPEPEPVQWKLPMLLAVPEEGCLLFETRDSGREPAIATLNNLVLRFLSVAPAGRVVFTILDPLDLGQNFAGLMHLTDHEDRLINRKIWTQPEQIEQRLAELNEHIEKVTQLYLRNEYQTITEYNEKAGRIAEPYHFLVVADFPVNFSELAVKRLLSIAASGPRCGVYTWIQWDLRKPAPVDFVPDDLREASVRLVAKDKRFLLPDHPIDGTSVHLESPPDAAQTTAFLQRVGQSSVDSNRVEMPFRDIAPGENELWSKEARNELRVPIGRTGATKHQQLALGKGTQQHVLIAGKTGSGKSTLFHVMITNLALWFSPREVEFYLVDFKKGVEFKCYATHRLPHARVVAIESDREFGLSVLERVDEELRRRGDLFRQSNVQDLAGYERQGGAEPLPRTLLMIDEFQEFFVEDDRVSQNAALLLDRLVRQGRAFGIHVLLGSQTLGGAYTLARTTLGQMVVRIALQCNEADAYLIMDDENAAPRLLSRPGEAIYNDSAGAIEGNSPFQIVWLPDEERDRRLKQIEEKAAQSTEWKTSRSVVFEGNAPADIRENELLIAALSSDPAPDASVLKAWIGAPNAIKGPTEVQFLRQSGNHLLIVGQRDEAALSVMGSALISLSAQAAGGQARFHVLDISQEGTRHRQFIEKLVRQFPQPAELVDHTGIESLLNGLVEELEKRGDHVYAAEAPAIFLAIHGLSRFKSLKYEEDFSFSLDDSEAKANPGEQLNRLITEGAQSGIHILCSVDSFNNATRHLSRKALGEFELRVVFQMSANDSASLIETPKAANLGLHRAILNNTQAGALETFRPYALPVDDWLEEAGKLLATRA